MHYNPVLDIAKFVILLFLCAFCVTYHFLFSYQAWCHNHRGRAIFNRAIKKYIQKFQ